MLEVLVVLHSATKARSPPGVTARPLGSVLNVESSATPSILSLERAEPAIVLTIMVVRSSCRMRRLPLSLITSVLSDTAIPTGEEKRAAVPSPSAQPPQSIR
jgi:hypothetical protein